MSVETINNPQAPIGPIEEPVDPTLVIEPFVDEDKPEKFALTEEQRQKALKKLENLGYISHAEDGQLIADLDKIDSYSTVQGSKFEKLIGKSGFYVLQHIFHNLPVISQKDYEQGIRDPKPLFYDPVSDEAALDQKTIREADFYLNPWKGNRKVVYPRIQELNAEETNLALFIFHPKYGDGFRDPQTGQLMVKDNERRYHPIRWDYFLKNYHCEPRITHRKSTGFHNSPNQFLQNKGKHLLERGIITTNDFRSLRRIGEKLEPFVTKKVDTDNGFVYIDGIKYYVGKGMPEGTEAKVLDDGTVMVVSGPEEKVVGYFTLKPELRKKDVSLTTLNAPETDFRPFDRQNYIVQQRGETDEVYQNRMEALQKFEMKPIQTENLPPKTRARMKAISRENWSQIDNPTLGTKISSDFGKILDDNHPSRWYLAQVNNELLGFVRFDDISDAEVYAGSLNVDEQSRGAQIGESILKSCLQKEAQTKVVKGTAYPKIPIAAKYLTPQLAGGYGFVATGITYYEGTEVPFLKMEIDQKKNAEYQVGKLAPDNILEHYQNNQYQESDDLIVLRYDPIAENDQMMIACNALLGSEERVMTSFRADPTDKSYRYLVFEKAIKDQVV